MKKYNLKSQSVENQTLVKDYAKIVNASGSSYVIVNTEWTKSGDYFQKFSMYDSGYTPVKTLGDTTLIDN